jgi:hypothetical protein
MISENNYLRRFDTISGLLGAFWKSGIDITIHTVPEKRKILG